jgi:omega-6 fatty acid desaturase (delta-12 desaturase)
MFDENQGAARNESARPFGPVARRGEEKPAWVLAMKKYEKPNARKVAMQLLDTVTPYLALVALMYLTMSWHLPYVVTLILAVPAGALLMRLFIIFHDCSHGSYVASPIWQQIIGNLLGVLTFTAFADWRRSHGIHHSSSGNLDRRGVGDVWTMTMDEYAASSPSRRLWYRVFRNPFVMFGLGPFFSFLIVHRWPKRGSNRSQILSVILTNVVIASIIAAAGLTVGIKDYLLIQLPILFFGGAGGVWLFYIQHQFDPSYWARTEEWESMEAAMRGSSYYKLPRVLQWISGNIGFHHVHHLRPRIPNYNLQQCLNETPELQLPDPLRLWPSLLSVRLKVWDEKQKLLLTLRDMKRQLLQRRSLAQG